MKKITFVCLFATLTSLVYAQQRVIERPPFMVWNMSTLEISKITLDDKATILDINAYGRAKTRITIASESWLKDDKGILYPIRYGEGIDLGQQFYFPESGEASFKLFFDPVPESAVTLDFSEGNGQRAFRIWGIQLQSDTLPPLILPDEAVVHQPDMDADLPEPQIKYGKGVLKGKILEYRPEMGELSVFLGSSDLTMGGIARLNINNKGEFRYEANLTSVKPGKLNVNNQEIDFFIAPGEETEIIVNLREWSQRKSRLHKEKFSCGQPVYFNGYLASLQQELQTNKIQTMIGRNYERMLTDIAGMDVHEVADYILAERQKIYEKIAKLPVSRACKEVLQTNVDLSAVDRICSAGYMLAHADVAAQKLSSEERMQYMEANRDRLTVVNLDVVKEKFPVVNQAKALYAFNNMYAVATLMKAEENVAKALGTDRGTLFDNIKSRQVDAVVKGYIPLTPEQEAELATLSSTAYLEQFRETNRKLLEANENRKKRMENLAHMDIKEVSNADLYTALVRKYRGKVVLIDIWATWCAPCRVANKEMKPLKEEWKDKNIAFVYIAGENSPQDLWKKMIADIDGEHHRLTKNQYDYLMESFNTQGVPTYIIVDKNGSVARVITGYPGLDTMKKELLQAMEED